MKATLHLCGGSSWEIELDGQEVEIAGQCTKHEDCYRVLLKNGQEQGYFSRHELVTG